MKEILVVSLIFVVLLSGCTNQSNTSSNIQTETPETKTKDYTFIQTITYRDENSSIIVIKNKLLKTASIEMNFFYNSSELKPDFAGFNIDLTNFTTTMLCGLTSMAFFNKTALEEFNREIRELNSKNFEIKDDSPPEQREDKPKENPLEGYNVTQVQLYLKDKMTNNKISECIITGSTEDKINIKIY